jgi:hypothetical protein
MQVVSGAVHDRRVHSEGMPSSQVVPEMDRFRIGLRGIGVVEVLQTGKTQLSPMQ